MTSSKIPPWLRPTRGGTDWRAYEVEVLPGLEATAADELRARFGAAARLGTARRPGRLPLLLRGDASPLLALRSAVAVHAVERFDVRSPARLLDPANWPRLLAAVRSVVEREPTAFATLRLSAAGADSLAFTRLADGLLDALGLRRVRAGGDLLLAVRRADEEGWEALVRLTPRPLSARAWRVCNLPGALDATAAHAMARLTSGSPAERLLNLACGSATLLVERLALGPAGAAVGVDREPAALACARANLDAAGARAALVRADLSALPFGDRSFDTALADLPYGMLMGSPEANRALYRGALDETARVLRPGGGFVVVTASWRLLESLLQDRAADWRLERSIRLSVPFARGYLKPTIHHLRRV